MATTSEQAINILEDTSLMIKKVQINLKKCPKERFTRGYIESRIKTLDEYWNTFKKAHESLVKHTTRDQRGIIPYFVNEEFYQSEDLYLHLSADLTDMLALHTKNVEVAEANNSSSSFVATGGASVKLPTIHLPTFMGNYEEWPTYQDMFLSLVDQNAALSQVQKLHYLKTTVAGEAATLLKHIQVTESNYAQAWAALKNRYGNLRVIVNSLLRRLFTQKKCTSQSVQMLKSILDTTNECLNSLKNLKVCTDSWDPLLIFLVVQKLDPETHRDWEEYAYKTDTEKLPTWEQLQSFLETKFRTLELLTPAAATTRERTVNKERAFHLTTTSKQCIKCKGDHTLSRCKDFIQMVLHDRSGFVKNNNLCFNCLKHGHNAYKCKVSQSCHICKRRHHSLLHLPSVVRTSESKELNQPVVSTESNAEEVQVNTVVALNHTNEIKIALLATALVMVESEDGKVTMLKALVDKGSQACFISEKAAQILKLRRQHTTKFVTGVESMRVTIKHEVSIQVKSRWGSDCLPVRAYVMSEPLATHIPKCCYTRINEWPHISGLTLADPNYYISGKIDLLLGVKEYATILQEGLVKGPPGTPVAQKTSFGWIIFGEISIRNDALQDTAIVLHQQLEREEYEEINMQHLLKRLWEIDSNENRTLTNEEKKCEEFYNKTHRRDSTGRYIVKLPFKSEEIRSTEGNTKAIAMNRLLHLERRFKRDPDLKEEYTKVIEEYEKLKHVEKIPKEEINKKGVYLPHHAVCHEDKESTKTRIVFDASCKGSNGVSLNDELLLGPVLQGDLRSLLMRWRMHRVCFVADIHKMYRMILVDEEHCDFQRILWRTNPSQEVTEYRLLRVTFGLAPSPYLAVRTLLQLAADEGDNYPEAAKILREDFYVDDLMSGCDTPIEAIQIHKDLKTLLHLGGFELKKWASNNAEFLNSLEPSERSANTHIDLNVDGKVKTLGILWDLKYDRIEYIFPTLSLQAVNITKRSILSEIQKLFDPLGWIAPCLVRAKILLQKLWLERLSWDDEITSPLREEWLDMRADMTNVNDIKVNRWLSTTSINKDAIQIHGFCDASMKAYAATVYCRVENPDDTASTTLIAAKTRVAPLKTVSLPRLELCGAVLLAQLMAQVGFAMKVPAMKMYAWTDSTIVLAWLAGEPSRWKPFVANRTAEILSNISINQWHHVLSPDNPADIASRGMSIKDLKESRLWWEGPEWLSNKVQIEDVTQFSTELEMSKIQSHLIEEIKSQEREVIIFENYSTLIELQRTIVYCKRFINYKKREKIGYKISKAITTEELQEALKICIIKSQGESFEDDIRHVQLKKDVKKTSCLKSLNAYLDEENLLRVGGRLRNANISPENKHPIILHHKNKFTYLVVADAHTKTLHGGVELMLCYLRSTYWIIKAKNLVKKYIRGCLICAKQSSVARHQIMGDLPQVRVTPARPFSNSGVDFAGPIAILTAKGRGAKTRKAYIAIFVCMATKAIHLELVSDLSSAAFIAAFKRFCARRGRCTNLWSDQGRNFIGASKELEQAWKEVCLDFEGEIAESLAADGTQWHFIPAYSPNFGGLWESGVKSLKHHLKRILTTNLTFEELTTVLCQIEACLNSRPLSPVEECDDSIQPLTPGHFLIGEAPIAVPEPSLQNVKMSNLSRWHHLQKLLNNFWSRWQHEYLTRLQQRPKWQRSQKEMEIGDIVHIKYDNLPPGKWMLGRIVAKHPGPDGLTRVYSVKSGDTITKRPITKLCLLPVNQVD